MENNLEEKLGAILSDPSMMQKIQAMAQSLAQPPVQEPPQQTPQAQTSRQMPPVDLAMVQQLAGFAGQTGIDNNQQALLSALSPYIAGAKISKLENAMRAAKMARLASAFLGNGGLQKLTGR